MLFSQLQKGYFKTPVVLAPAVPANVSVGSAFVNAKTPVQLFVTFVIV
jgi:hypothetical protein